MDFRSDEVVLDLLVNDIEDNEDNGGEWRAEEKKGTNEDAANDGAKHWDEIESEGD